MRESLETYCRRKGLDNLLDQWDAERNLPLTPDRIPRGSKQRVWWMCEKGHSWQAAVYTRSGSRTGCPVCAGKIPQPAVNDLATLYPDLARQWHPVRNGDLRPDQVLPGSHRSVWWRCERGHEWQAKIKSRTAGSGCPICANREVYLGCNDLATQFPELARQWHPTKNGALRPDQVVSGSSRKVWWVCAHGHEWKAAIASRALSGNSCPVCAGRKVAAGENDLASHFPSIAAQWHPTKNGDLTPQQVTPSSNRKVWWRCELGHDYQAAVSSRTMNGSGCPYCADHCVLPGFNDLATRAPEVAAQWHPTLNGTLTPDMVMTGSHRKVWWICPLGHVWKAVIYSRTGTRKCGCPVCAGRTQRSRAGRYRRLEADREHIAWGGTYQGLE